MKYTEAVAIYLARYQDVTFETLKRVNHLILARYLLSSAKDDDINEAHDYLFAFIEDGESGFFKRHFGHLVAALEAVKPVPLQYGPLRKGKRGKIRRW